VKPKTTASTTIAAVKNLLILPPSVSYTVALTGSIVSYRARMSSY
jgi:hypothetical protein